MSWKFLELLTSLMVLKLFSKSARKNELKSIFPWILMPRNLFKTSSSGFELGAAVNTPAVNRWYKKSKNLNQWKIYKQANVKQIAVHAYPILVEIATVIWSSSTKTFPGIPLEKKFCHIQKEFPKKSRRFLRNSWWLSEKKKRVTPG